MMDHQIANNNKRNPTKKKEMETLQLQSVTTQKLTGERTMPRTLGQEGTMSGKGLLSKIYKDFLKLNSEKQSD